MKVFIEMILIRTLKNDLRPLESRSGSGKAFYDASTLSHRRTALNRIQMIQEANTFLESVFLKDFNHHFNIRRKALLE